MFEIALSLGSSLQLVKTLLAAGADANVLFYDSSISAGVAYEPSGGALEVTLSAIPTNVEIV